MLSPVPSSTSLASSTSTAASQGDFPGYMHEIAYTTNPGDAPVWEDETAYVKSLSTNRGKDSELDMDQPGTATYVLRNDDRRFDSTYAAGPHFGFILPMRRIRSRFQWNGTWDPGFTGYIESWPQSWPDRLFQSEVTVSAVDGFKALTLKAQPTTDPSEDSYPDVISFDEPFFYGRFGEPSGTKVVHHVRTVKKKKLNVGGAHGAYIVEHKRRWKTRETRAEVEGIAGPAGDYRNTPTLGEPGAIAGDSDTSVLFTRANSEYARIPLENAEDFTSEALTLEAWVKPRSLASGVGNRNMVLAAPMNSTLAEPVAFLYINNAGVAFRVPDGLGATDATTGTPLPLDQWAHVMGTKDVAGNLVLYINGVQVGTGATTGAVAPNDANLYLYIGSSNLNLANNAFDGWIDEPAPYQRALSASRAAAHYEAGLRGYAQEMTGDRIANVLSAAGLGFDESLQAGQRQILPVRQSGQSSTEPIDEALAAEGGPSRFFFSGFGEATYLDRDHRTGGLYTASRATFGDDGTTELPYEDLNVSYDESFLFNQVRVEASGGTLQEVNDTTSQDSFFTRTLDRTGVPMVSDADALDEATDLLARFKDPIQRVTSITFQLGFGSTSELMSDMQAAVLERDLGDYITVTRRPDGGAAITQSSYIERISHSVDFEGRSWQTVFGVSPK